MTNDREGNRAFREPSSLWTTYVQQMAPFFFNLLSELFEAMNWCHGDFEPEDVHVLKELADIFGIIQPANNGEDPLTLQGVMTLN